MASNDRSLMDRFNSKLKGVFRTENIYAEVYVLLLYWQDTKAAGFKQEADALEHLFEKGFGYPPDHIKQFEIPLKQSQIALEAEILSFMLNKTQDSLLIIHYGGHGDADDDPERQRPRLAVWATSTVGGPTIDWHKIQPRLLNEAEADVLLILDCCYSASAARERPKVKNRVELLCATSMKRQTPPPGPTSFTSIMIREIKSLLSGNRGVTISKLHNHLMKQQSGLFETSVWVELQAGSGRHIKLEKLSPHIPISTPPASSLTFKVSTRQRLDENVFLEILNWMQNLSPRVISELAVEKVWHSTEMLREFVQEEPSEISPQPMFQQLPENARQEALDLCRELDAVLEGGAALARLPSAFNPDTSKNYEDMARRFVNELESKVRAIKRSLERNIVARCVEREALIQAMNNTKVQNLGIADTLRMKDILLEDSDTSNYMKAESKELGFCDNTVDLHPRSAQKELDQLGHSVSWLVNLCSVVSLSLVEHVRHSQNISSLP
ncbi:hypothetical protein L207DRAFT_517151 [Hyaloscypha variabilis F]|uniref:Uncharacterized protein n=1 Tax=Hyaloscypha variabilis (strain UAMH 11265 / GT02V1 / F) TaxID=1149755 RepID=A0A2J6R940_HYAVF|nr:hypothetical protein L207DRAFT_517151 [Hyaloscypha variabilis F]